jgi:hypothetical protein
VNANVGLVVRAVVGVALLAFALGIGVPETGWYWLGWIGIVPLATAVLGSCSLYSVFGLSTSPLRHRPS